jgi:ribosome-binding factor A
MSKTAYKRSTRVADQIRMEVADILMRKTKDPRVGIVTVTDVELTSDLRIARVFVTAGPDEKLEAGALAGLTKAAGFIRTELGRRVNLRYTPELIFQKDTTGARGDRILSLLNELETASDTSGTPSAQSEDPIQRGNEDLACSP